MELESIGRNKRKYRKAKKLRQEDLAERAGLNTNYISAMERGEKLPSLETFIDIVNALGVSSDMLLADVVETSYTVKTTQLSEQLEKIPGIRTGKNLRCATSHEKTCKVNRNDKPSARLVTSADGFLFVVITENFYLYAQRTNHYRVHTSYVPKSVFPHLMYIAGSAY